MAISVDWATQVISIPKSYLTLVSGTVYDLDTDLLFHDLKALEDDEEGIVFPDTLNHNSEVTVAGTTFAQVIEIINGYSVEFEDGAYSVRLAGSNNNIFDVGAGILVQNTVQVIAQNSGGLVVGVGAAPGDVWDVPVEGAYTAQEVMRLLAAALAGKTSIAAGTRTFRDLADTKDRLSVDVDGTGNRTSVTTDVS